MIGITPSGGNDQPAMQAIIDALAAAGGGTVSGGGRTFNTSSPLIVKDGVTLDLEGGKILAALSGANDCGVRLRNYAAVCNGEIKVQSSGSPGSQGGIHAPVLVGALHLQAQAQDFAGGEAVAAR